MNFRIKETKELKTLGIFDEDGIEWTADLLGNHGELHYNSETEEHELTQESFEWWSEYIKTYLEDVQKIQEFANEFGLDENEIWYRVSLETTNDLGDDHFIVEGVLNDMRDELEG
jgi:hypothetical protein